MLESDDLNQVFQLTLVQYSDRDRPFALFKARYAVIDCIRHENVNWFIKFCPRCGKWYGMREMFCGACLARLVRTVKLVEYCDSSGYNDPEAEALDKIWMGQVLAVFAGTRRKIAEMAFRYEDRALLVRTASANLSVTPQTVRWHLSQIGLTLRKYALL